MQNNQSSFSISSSILSKINGENNSTFTINTINPLNASLSFRVKYKTEFGQLLYIIGNIEELGQWDPSKAKPMFTNNDLYPTWKLKKELNCPLGMDIYYKYIIKDKNKIIWEDLGQNRNRHITVSSPGNLIIFDEQCNNVSMIKYKNNENIDLSNTEYHLYQTFISALSQKQKDMTNKSNNKKFISSELVSNRSLSTFQKKTETLIQLTEEEIKNKNKFKSFSSKPKY